MKKKQGRPKKPENEKLSVTVGIVLTKEEKEQIEESAKRLDVSVNKYLRRLVLVN